MGTVQMLLSQLGLNPAAGSNVTIGGRQYRLMQFPEVEAAAATAGGPGSRGSYDSIAGAVTATMQSLVGRLMPQQHRLLALPPRVPAAENAALLATANEAAAASVRQQQQPAAGQGGQDAAAAGAAAPAAAAAGAAAPAAAGDDAAGAAAVRSSASSVSALTRLLSRVNEVGGGSSGLMNGRGTLVTTRHPGTGLMVNVAVNPTALMSPGLGGGGGMPSNLLQTLEALTQQPGQMLLGAGGAADDQRMWDDAMMQLLDALGPQPGARAQRIGGTGLPPVPGSRAGAAAGMEGGAGLDPRECVWGGVCGVRMSLLSYSNVSEQRCEHRQPGAVWCGKQTRICTVLQRLDLTM